MQHIQNVYLIKNKFSGYFLNERGYSFSENIVYGMMFESKRHAEEMMKTKKLSEHDYEIVKYFICQPVTEELT